MSTHLDAHRPEFARVIEHFQRDLTSLRTGRASRGVGGARARRAGVRGCARRRQCVVAWRAGPGVCRWLIELSCAA